MPVYPGTRPPVFKRECTFKEHGFNETDIHMFTHTGTHIDLPLHIIDNGDSTDNVPVDRFIGKGLVCDFAKRADNYKIRVADFDKYTQQINNSDFVIIYTGWSKKWGIDAYFEGFPVLTEEAMRYLATFNIKGIGMDAISPDPVGSETLPVHKIALAKGILIIENLTNIENLIDKDFTFTCFPLKFEKGDGSPIRAVAFW